MSTVDDKDNSLNFNVGWYSESNVKYVFCLMMIMEFLNVLKSFSDYYFNFSCICKNYLCEVVSMSEENNDKIDWESGWYSKPNIEYVIEPDDEDRGILESIKEFFRLLF